MDANQIKDWIDQIQTGYHISIPGYSSTSKSLKVALQFATGDIKEGNKAVLFVFAIRNAESINGMQMTNSGYSAYPSEQEILLMEGFSCYVLGVEEDVLIVNDHPSFKDVNQKKITIIYLMSFY